AKARQLLERYGVLTREAALGEGSEGGFAGVYPVLKALEERGEVRRGYFVSGLGAAQFAMGGAVDRLRSSRSVDRDETGQGLVLAATDPAQPYGAALPWPESAGRPARQAGAHVVLVDGELVAYPERGGHSVSTLEASADHPVWPEAIKVLAETGRYRSLEIRQVDGEPAGEPARRVPQRRDPHGRRRARRRAARAAGARGRRLPRRLEGLRPPPTPLPRIPVLGPAVDAGRSIRGARRGWWVAFAGARGRHDPP